MLPPLRGLAFTRKHISAPVAAAGEIGKPHVLHVVCCVLRGHEASTQPGKPVMLGDHSMPLAVAGGGQGGCRSWSYQQPGQQQVSASSAQRGPVAPAASPREAFQQTWCC